MQNNVLIILITSLKGLGKPVQDVVHGYQEMKVDGNQKVDSLFIQQLINIYLKKINKYNVPIKIQVNGVSSLYEKALASLLENQKEVTLINEEWFLPQPKLVILGAGHVSQYVSKLASMLDFYTIVIDERNSEYKYACDGKLKCKRDGRTFIDGVETGVENKYSNSTSECFTDSLGYKIQCQAYMMAWGLDQWLLCGMWQGKPAMKIIKKDEEMQKDIETIVEAVVEILMGMREVEDYPWEIVEKYSKQVMLVELNSEDIEDYDKKLLHNIAILKDKKKAIEEKLAEYEDYAKKNYADCKYSDSDYNFTISTSNGRKTFDKNTFSIEHPTIDVEKYYKEGSPFRTIRVTKKKGK